MRITERDLKLVRDVALSHLLTRDQTVRLGYFGSVCRANSRLHALCGERLLTVCDTPFHRQFMYRAGPKAAELVGDRIAALLRARAPSPRFVRHALAVTDVRLHFQSRGFAWRFEPQVRDEFTWKGKKWEARPDGVGLGGGLVAFVEADLGNVALGAFLRKLKAYAAYVDSGACRAAYRDARPEVLVVTTGALRKKHLEQAGVSCPSPRLRVVTFAELGISVPGSWS